MVVHYNLETNKKTNMAISVKIPMQVGFSQTICMAVVNPFNLVNQELDNVTQQEGLTRLDYFFFVAYKHLTAKGLPFAVIIIQSRSDANPGLLV